MPSHRQAPLSPDAARRLMSQLLDGELSAEDAESLAAHLAERPEEADWLEAADLATRRPHGGAARREGEALAPEMARKAIESAGKEPEAKASASAIPFPRWAPLAAAAGLALALGLGWMAWKDGPAAPGPVALEPSRVEYVATDIPDASAAIYSDAASGWTVVWISAAEAIPEQPQAF